MFYHFFLREILVSTYGQGVMEYMSKLLKTITIKGLVFQEIVVIKVCYLVSRQKLLQRHYSYSRTNYGLRTPNEAFFHWNPLGRQIGQIDSGAFGVFSAKLSAPILVQWVTCPCFPLFHYCFCKKLSHIPNIYLGLRFKFGLQRIRDLAFMCP